MKYVMVINMGLKSIRCIVFNQQGVKLASAAIPINTAINQERVEQDPREWWEKAVAIMKTCAAECRGVVIDYITVTASASCLVCADSQGNALDRAYMISDKRAASESREMEGCPEFEEVFQRTSLPMSSSLLLPRILWVKRHLPEVFEKSRYFLTPNDYMIMKLCGACVTDYFNAMKYHYDPAAGTYPESLLSRYGIPSEAFPRVVSPGAAAGFIRPELAAETGISASARAVVTSYDAICSFVGSGAAKEGEASDVSGTVTVFRTMTRKTGLKENPVIYRLPFYQEEGSILGGSNNMGGGLIEWVKQCYYQKETYPYEVMEKEAGESEPGARGLLFLPYLLGERAPIWDDNARGVFFGLERMHTRRDMTRAVFESAGFIDRDLSAAVEKTGVNISSVRLSGGLARVNLISQIKADILGCDVMVLSEFETTSSGAAMLALIGAGVFPNVEAAAEQFVSIRMIIRPDRKNHEKYQNWYRLYKDAYATMKDLFVRRKEAVRQMDDGREVQIENL